MTLKCMSERCKSHIIYIHMTVKTHVSAHAILLELKEDWETTVWQHGIWQGQRKHHGKHNSLLRWKTHTNNNRAPRQSQRPRVDRLLQFTFLCVETCRSQEKDALAEEHESRWASARTRTQINTRTHMSSQEAAITLHAGMSASPGHLNTHAHTLVSDGWLWLCTHQCAFRSVCKRTKKDVEMPSVLQMQNIRI